MSPSPNRRLTLPESTRAERPPADGGIDLLSETQVDAVLPVDRSTRWALRRRPRDPLPAFKVGGRVLYDRNEIEAWIWRQREKPVTPKPRRGRPRKTQRPIGEGVRA